MHSQRTHQVLVRKNIYPKADRRPRYLVCIIINSGGDVSKCSKVLEVLIMLIVMFLQTFWWNTRLKQHIQIDALRKLFYSIRLLEK